MSFCNKFRSKVRSLLQKIDQELEKIGPVALKITTGVRNALAGVPGDILTAIIPGDVDNHLRESLVNVLTKSIDYLAIIDTCQNKTGALKVQCFIDELKKKSPKLQESILIKLASAITMMLHQGQLSQHEYDTFVQLQYSLQKKAA